MTILSEIMNDISQAYGVTICKLQA